MDAKHTLGEPRVLISRSALLHNAALLRRSIHGHVRICAMLKADAYGHGAALVADTLCNFSADAAGNRPAVEVLGVASLDEAAALPAVDATLIVFRPLENVFIGRHRDKVEQAVRSGWVLTVGALSVANDLARVAMACEGRAQVQIMVDTGMTRCGVPIDRLDDLLHKIGSRPSLRLAGICTHFASAERADDPFTRKQLSRFCDATDAIASAMPGRFLRHAANSGALFFTPSCHMDMVRPGIGLYGIDPTGRPDLNRALRPAMRWTAPLLAIHSIRKGTGVGYGQSWIAPRDTRIGLLPVGYADGYPRSFGGRAVVMLNGRPLPVVGRVSMDMTTIDLGSTSADIGDEVTLLDSDPLSPASVYALAKWADTIPYEIFCRIGPRIPRVIVEKQESATMVK